MTKLPRISVIIPCYNHGKYIADAVDSVLQQSFQDFEIIIADDCSNDAKTPMQIKEVAKSDKRIKTVFLDKNRGHPGCRNAAIKEARGTYILPLDADDKIAHDCLEKAITAMEKESADLVYWHVQQFGKEHKFGKAPPNPKKQLLFMACIASCCLYRKSDWQRYGGYNEKMRLGAEEYDFYINFAKESKKFVLIDEPLLYYRREDNSGSQTALENRWKLYKQVKKNHPEYFTFRNYYLNPYFPRFIIFKYKQLINKNFIQLRFNRNRIIVRLLGVCLIDKKLRD